jgi:hypothetical protein
MSTDSRTELEQFYEFYGDLLKRGTKLTPEEIVELWRDLHPDTTPEEPHTNS